MDHFSYRQGVYHAEGVAIPALADVIGTPFYCYSSATLTHHYRVFHDALASLNPRICFAVKANSNLGVLATLARLGAGADVVSEGEARRALAAGIPAEKIVFSGVGKTKDEMRFALEQGISQFNVESDRELRALSEVATNMGVKAPVALRVNPDVDAATHAKISTGKKENKFGIAMDHAADVYALAAMLPGIRVVGISVHIGSQLTSLAPFRTAYRKLRALVLQLRAAGHPITRIDLGGGLGVPYLRSDDVPPPPAEYAEIVRETMAGLNAQLMFEPGRLIAGNAGILVTKVLYVKQAAAHLYVIVDAGMNDLMRPALYDAQHEILPICANDAPLAKVTVAGPVCESSDVFAKDIMLPLPTEGDLLALRTAGAYGASMANSYNSRLLIPELLVKGSEFAITRPRPSYEEMLAAERLPEWI